MSRAGLLMRMLFKAAWVRKDRALMALISVAVVATIATATLTLYSDLENKLGHEFRGFGANVIVNKNSGAFEDKDVPAIQELLGDKGLVVPVAYAVATAQQGSKIVVGGADLNTLKQLDSWWELSGAKPGKALVGARADETLGHPASLTLSFAQRTETIQTAAVFHSGSDDDSRIYVPLDDFVKWTLVRPGTALVRIDGSPGEIQEAIAHLRRAFAPGEVQPVRQITQTQSAIVGKTRSVVLACSAVVVTLIMLCMVATFTSSVLERRKDFAVMKALGASNRAVNTLFAAEAALLALAGAVAGFAAGSGIAYWIGRANFDAAISPELGLLLPVLLGSVLLALIASVVPLRRLQQIQPAGILRGE